ncbi:DNA-binding MarR family transcriptional regulator [Stackebrandtia albiflava]|uniref:DNA-binding MarR family transcriptional regulator n=1 Tax=Stackebrandtia albiflava TaxID=406432 RepID=A0A562URW4_9ACTN|nr:MarR family transcriptional regulator [Stackebrandtia albiflava]TWJ08350.1 DNA-binding MarR family transcriptional regulator [Stackebrandtia albiflava]
MTDHDLAASLNLLLRDLVLALRATPHEGVSPPQLTVLATLEDGPLRMTALAARHGVKLPTMTAQVNRLERDGLVVRQRRDRDARVVTVELTGTGRITLRRGIAHRTRFLAERLAGLDDTERDAIAAALPALARLARRDDPPADPPRHRDYQR